MPGHGYRHKLSEYRVYLKNHAPLDRLYSNVFIVGCHHAREWISVEIPLLFAKYLLENYKLDPQVQKVVEGAQYISCPLYPWGYTLLPAPDAARMNAIARELAGRIFLVSGRVYTYGSLVSALYLSNGDFNDWIYGAIGSPAFTIELSLEYMEEGGFFTSEQMIAAVFADNLPALFYFVDYFISGLDENGNPLIPPDDMNPFYLLGKF